MTLHVALPASPDLQDNEKLLLIAVDFFFGYCFFSQCLSLWIGLAFAYPFIPAAALGLYTSLILPLPI